MSSNQNKIYFDLAHANLRDTIKYRIENIDGGIVYENNNYMFYTIGKETNDPHLNGVLSFNDKYADEIVEKAEEFFHELGFSYSFWVRDNIDSNLERILIDRGLEPKRKPGSSVMIIDKKLENNSLPNQYSLVAVNSLKEIRDFKSVINEAFEKTDDISDVVFSSNTLLDSDKVQAFLIYNDKNIPVSSSITSITDDVAGIYYVGTIESERSKGLGKAIMQAATNIGFNRDKEMVILQASELGEFVYNSLGYKKIAMYRAYTVDKKRRDNMNIVDYKEVIDFWFDPEHAPLHFGEDDDFDEKVRSRFLKTWEAASEGLLLDWRKDIKGRLAEIIVLDQFSRNLWRHDIKTYTQDKMAIALAQEVVMNPDYDKLSDDEKRFVLLPFMHSESLELHDWADKYYEELGDEDLMYFEKLHRDILEEFGRYPYQNEDLGRKSTPEEIKILEERKDGFYS